MRVVVLVLWAAFSFSILHPLWLGLVDGPAWVGPVEVVGAWDAPWWVRHSFVPFWLLGCGGFALVLWAVPPTFQRLRQRLV